MKMLLCEECMDIVVPDHRDRVARHCRCYRHAVWWDDGVKGTLKIFDARREQDAQRTSDADGHRTVIYPRRAYVIGLTNALLTWPEETLTAASVQEMIDMHPDSYLFKRYRSLVVRFRPGHSSDTSYADALP